MRVNFYTNVFNNFNNVQRNYAQCKVLTPLPYDSVCFKSQQQNSNDRTFNFMVQAINCDIKKLPEKTRKKFESIKFSKGNILVISTIIGKRIYENNEEALDILLPLIKATQCEKQADVVTEILFDKRLLNNKFLIENLEKNIFILQS